MWRSGRCLKPQPLSYSGPQQLQLLRFLIIRIIFASSDFYRLRTFVCSYLAYQLDVLDSEDLQTLVLPITSLRKKNQVTVLTKTRIDSSLYFVLLCGTTSHGIKTLCDICVCLKLANSQVF